MAPHSRFDGPFSAVQGLVGWATLALALLLAIPQGGNQPVAWTLFGMAVLGLFAVQIVLSLLRPNAVALARAAPLALLYAAVVAWAMVQVALPAPAGMAHPYWSLAPEGASPRISADPGNGAHMVLRLATYGMVAFILAASALNGQRAWAYLKAIALFSVPLAVYGIWGAAQRVNPVLGFEEFGPSYVSATFVSRNAYASYAAFGFLTNVAIYLHMTGRGAAGGHDLSGLRAFLTNFFCGAWIYAIGALLCGAALVLTQSRAGTVAAALCLVALVVLLGNRRRTSWVALAAVVVGIGGYVAFAFGGGTWRRLVGEGLGDRFIVYEAIVRQIVERPLIGHGIGAFHETFRAHVPLAASEAEWDFAHNSYLENAYELGLPAAAVLYLVLLAIFLRLVFGMRRRESDHAIPALAAAVTVTAAAHSLLDFPLQMPAIAALFAAIVGIGWSQSFRKEDRRSMTRREAENDI